MTDLIDSGRRFYEVKKYKRALEQFTRVSSSPSRQNANRTPVLQPPAKMPLAGHEKLFLC